MANSSWGKQPPLKTVSNPPDLDTPNFWGKAPVPPKVKTFWDEVIGETRPAKPYAVPEGRGVTNTHDSWRDDVLGTEGSEFSDPEAQERSSDFTAPSGRGVAGTEDSWRGDVLATEGGVDGEITPEERSSDFTAPSGRGVTDGHDSWRGDVLATEGGVDGEITPEERENDFTAPSGRGVAGTEDSWRGDVLATQGGEFEDIQGASRPSDYTAPGGRGVTEDHDSWMDPILATKGGFFWFLPRFGRAANPYAAAAGRGVGAAAGKTDEVNQESWDEQAAPDGRGVKAQHDSWASSLSARGLANVHDSWMDAVKKTEGKDYQFTGGSSRAASPPASTSGRGSVASTSSTKMVDPFVGAWNFRVRISGVDAVSTKIISVSGLSIENEAISFKKSNSNLMETFPGRNKYADVEITKMFHVDGDAFFEWMKQIEDGDDEKRDISIYLHHLDLTAEPVFSLQLTGCWPVKWQFPDLSGGASEGAVEKITLSVSGIVRNRTGAVKARKIQTLGPA